MGVGDGLQSIKRLITCTTFHQNDSSADNLPGFFSGTTYILYLSGIMPCFADATATDISAGKYDRTSQC